MCYIISKQLICQDELDWMPSRYGNLANYPYFFLPVVFYLQPCLYIPSDLRSNEDIFASVIEAAARLEIPECL